MGGNVKEKEEPKLADAPRISPVNEVEYVNELISQYLAITQIEYVKDNAIESEWDDPVSSALKSQYTVLNSFIEELSTELQLQEKGLALNRINLHDFEVKIKEWIKSNDYTYNMDSVLIKYRKLWIRRLPLVLHIYAESTLPKRDKEIIILRTTLLCKSEYIWDHHIDELGLSNIKLGCILNSQNTEEVDSFDSTLISAVDELYTNAILFESTWNSLSQRYTIYQIMDLMFTVGFYISLSYVLNTFKIQSENIVKDYLVTERLPSFKEVNNGIRPKRIIGKTESFRLKNPRITPLNEVEYVKELMMFHTSLTQFKYKNGKKNETECGREFDSLIQWIKNYNKREIDGLSTFLKLEEKELTLSSIILEDFEDSIKTFIKQEGTIFNLKATMMQYRKLRLVWLIQASHLTYDSSSLPPRDKEILILRIAWLNGANYEWDHHVNIGKSVGLTNNDINCIKDIINVKSLNIFDRVLINSVDEIYRDTLISDSTWNALSEHYTTNQLMDLVFTVGAYNMLAFFLNSFGIQTEECVKKILD